MNTSFKTDRSYSLLPVPTVSIRGDLSRNVGNMRAVTLSDRMVNTDRIFGAGKSVEDSFARIFREGQADGVIQ